MYNKTQQGWVIIIPLSICILYAGIKLLRFHEPLNVNLVLYIVLLMLVTSLILFYKLTVYVDENSVGFKFGIGLIRKEFPLEQIVSCEPVRNKWWYGWGIRLHPDFTLYNVNGLDAIEISLKDRNRKIRIGTGGAGELSDIINQRINQLK